MRTPNPPWMSLSRTIGIKSAEKQRIRAGKLPAGSIPAPFEALGKTGGGLSCRKTASPRSAGHRAAGGRCPHGQPPFSPFQSRPRGKVFPARPIRTRLCVGFPISPATVRNAQWLPLFSPRSSQKCARASPVFSPQQSEMRNDFPRFFPAAVVGHIHKLSPVLHCRTRLCVDFPSSPPVAVRNAHCLPPFFPRRGSHSSPRSVRGWRKWRGGKRKKPTSRRPQFLF